MHSFSIFWILFFPKKYFQSLVKIQLMRHDMTLNLLFELSSTITLVGRKCTMLNGDRPFFYPDLYLDFQIWHKRISFLKKKLNHIWNSPPKRKMPCGYFKPSYLKRYHFFSQHLRLLKNYLDCANQHDFLNVEWVWPENIYTRGPLF